jgi:hypothetical protein
MHARGPFEADIAEHVENADGYVGEWPLCEHGQCPILPPTIVAKDPLSSIQINQPLVRSTAR